jgi:hypothetical protein
MGGGHRPGEPIKVRCAAKSGLSVDFLSDAVSVEILFTKPEDADYFTVGTDYVVVFTPAGGDIPGQSSAEPKPGG